MGLGDLSASLPRALSAAISSPLANQNLFYPAELCIVAAGGIPLRPFAGTAVAGVAPVAQFYGWYGFVEVANANHSIAEENESTSN